jgi:DNA replication licensing factor MCM2
MSTDREEDDENRLRSDEEDGEDVYGDNYQQDYRAISELDRYDDEVASEEDVDMDADAFAAAQAEMNRRDQESARRGGRQAAALRAVGEDGGSEFDELADLRRQRAAAEDDALGGEAPMVNLEQVPPQAREFLSLDLTKTEIRRQFNRFLRSYRDSNNEPAYTNAISRMCADNLMSLDVSYFHVSITVPPLARFIVEHPDLILPLLHTELLAVAATLSPGYDSIQREVFVRIYNMPLRDKIRDLRQYHVNCLIRVWGVAIRRSGVFPQLNIAHYVCSCGERLPPIVLTGMSDPKPTRCPACQNASTMRLDVTDTVYRNYQKVTLQEAPGSVPAGRVPRQVDVIMLHDLIDKCAPGEEIEVTGIYKHAPLQSAQRSNHGFPVFSTVLEANHVGKSAVMAATSATTIEDENEILRLSRMPNIDNMIIRSIAPSIHGHEHIKTSIALSLFGGVAKENEETKHRLRGDINVLLLGDPGTAKSQFLKYTQKIASRSVYTTGKGASAVGLTASVRMDTMTREWTLEGGAMVLSDQGVCLIDEFDKMSDQDRTSIHEAMEQQTISVAKAGIVCTLKARCSVIAAANPISGRYNSSLSFQEQVNLTEPILSRFDVLCVVRDTANRENDRRLAEFIARSHRNAAPSSGPGSELAPDDNGGPGNPDLALGPGEIPVSTPEQRAQDYARNIIPQDVLRKYIAYARRTCRPSLAGISNDYINDFYGDLRLHAQLTGGVQMTLRQVAGIIRMAEAHAKMSLRSEVTDADVRFAIRTMLTSFISTQKLSVQQQLTTQFTKYLIDGIDRFELLRALVIDMRDQALQARVITQRIDADTARAQPVEVSHEEYRERALMLQLDNYDEFLASPVFAESGFVYNRETRKIICNNIIV